MDAILADLENSSDAKRTIEMKNQRYRIKQQQHTQSPKKPRPQTRKSRQRRPSFTASQSPPTHSSNYRSFSKKKLGKPHIIYETPIKSSSNRDRVQPPRPFVRAMIADESSFKIVKNGSSNTKIYKKKRRNRNPRKERKKETCKRERARRGCDLRASRREREQETSIACISRPLMAEFLSLCPSSSSSSASLLFLLLKLMLSRNERGLEGKANL